MSKKISSATIEKIIKANKKEVQTFIFKTADADIEVVIKPYISYEERTQMVNEIANNCYDENGAYHPEFFDIAYNIALIEYYTNINTNIKDSVNQMHILCENTNLISQIKSVIADAAGRIWLDAQSIISWRNEQSLKSNAWDDVAYMISGILDKIENKIDAMPEMTNDDLSKLMGVASKFGNVSEEKIVDGILKFHNKENKEK